MPAFDVPGLEFLATTGEYQGEIEWRTPVGTWFRQIIPTGCRLINLLEGMQNKCIELNELLDYDFEDDSLDGRITLSGKGAHVAPSSPHTFLGQHLIPALTAVLFVILRRVNSSHPSRKRYGLARWFQMGAG